jgi:hypothetical protein
MRPERDRTADAITGWRIFHFQMIGLAPYHAAAACRGR